MENAQTQLEINQCVGINLLTARSKLEKVLEKSGTPISQKALNF